MHKVIILKILYAGIIFDDNSINCQVIKTTEDFSCFIEPDSLILLIYLTELYFLIFYET